MGDIKVLDGGTGEELCRNGHTDIYVFYNLCILSRFIITNPYYRIIYSLSD